jgi:hypothetical protein
MMDQQEEFLSSDDSKTPLQNDHDKIGLVAIQLIHMGNEILQRDISSVEELIQARDAFTSWRDYARLLIPRFLGSSSITSEVSDGLSMEKYAKYSLELIPGIDELRHDIHEVVKIISRIKEDSTKFPGQDDALARIAKKGLRKEIPVTENALVLRTDFSDDGSWKSICKAIRKPVGEFQANVDFINDKTYEGVAVKELLSLISDESIHTFIFIVDSIASSHRDNPILVVDLYTEPGRTFRVIPSEMWGVENNLSIANMDFAEFANSTDPDGVFRGFPKE